MARELLDALGTSGNRRVFLLVLVVIVGFAAWTWWDRRTVDVPLVVEVTVFSDEARTRPRDGFDLLIDGSVVASTPGGVGVRTYETTAVRGREIAVGVASSDDAAITDGPRYRLVTPDLLPRDPEGRLVLREDFVLQSTRHRELFVRVVDEDGIPLAGVHVRADGRGVGESGGDGTVRFSAPDDAPIRIDVRLADSAFEPESRVVAPGSAPALTFRRVGEPPATDVADAGMTEAPGRRETPATRDEPPVRVDTPAIRDDSPVRTDAPTTRDEPAARVDTPTASDEPPVRVDAPATRDEPPARLDAPIDRDDDTATDDRAGDPGDLEVPGARDVLPDNPGDIVGRDPLSGSPGGATSTTLLFVTTLPGTLMVNDQTVGSPGPGPWTYRARVGEEIAAVLRPFARDGMGCRPRQAPAFAARAGHPDVRFDDFECGAPMQGAMDFGRDYARAIAHVRATPSDAHRVEVDPPASAAEQESYGRILWMRARSREQRGQIADALDDYRRSFEYRASATTAVDLLACEYQNAPCGDPELLERTAELAARQSISRETREKLRAYDVFIWNCRLQDASDKDARNLYRSRLCDAISEYFDGLSRGGPSRHAQDVRAIGERVGCGRD